MRALSVRAFRVTPIVEETADLRSRAQCGQKILLDTLRRQARVAEWQTRRTQNPLSERVCGFDSRLGHFALMMIRTLKS